MANRYAFQFLYSRNPLLNYLEGNCVIDSGQPLGTRSLKGSGIKAVSRLAVGTYKIEFEDTFARYLAGQAGFVSPVTGNTAITALTPGNIYIIRTVGSSTQANWETAGVPKGVAAVPGVPFKAAATSSGSGTAFSPSVSGIEAVEVVGDPNLTINQGADPYIVIQTLGATSAGSTVMIPKDPADGSVLGFDMFLRNSSNKGKGE